MIKYDYKYHFILRESVYDQKINDIAVCTFYSYRLRG